MKLGQGISWLLGNLQMFFYISVEKRVPKNHPLRPVKAMVEEALKGLNEKFTSCMLPLAALRLLRRGF